MTLATHDPIIVSNPNMTPYQHPFDAYVQSGDQPIRLARAALLFALDRHPSLDVDHYLAKLDHYSRRIAKLNPASALDRIAAIRTVLVKQEHFRGDVDGYNDPANSYLNEVIDRKRGLPITLSAIWLDVADQLDWPIRGINFPGHFLIGVAAHSGQPNPEDGETIIVDPFGGGRLLSVADCQALLTRALGVTAVPGAEHFRAADTREILTRMLNNLRIGCLQRQHYAAALPVLLRMKALRPEESGLDDEIHRVRRSLAELN